MEPGPPTNERDEEFWRDFLTHGDSLEAAARRVFKRIPSSPRCRLCAAPFRGPGAPLMRVMGKRQSDSNPNMCRSCFAFLEKHHGGAEVDGSYLFADIRGSTTLAEGMSPAEFHALLERFYVTASRVIFDNDGAIDKFVGDEVVAFFFPLIAGERHTARAVECAMQLLRETGHRDPEGPWAPIGAGVHSGRAWFGAVGDGSHTQLTAVGDAVNVAARLASQALAGEVIVSVDAAVAAGLDPGLPQRSLELKGREEPAAVVSLRVEPARA